MNKFIKFNSILFSSAIFLLNPVFGMESSDNKDEKPHDDKGKEHADEKKVTWKGFSDSHSCHNTEDTTEPERNWGDVSNSRDIDEDAYSTTRKEEDDNNNTSSESEEDDDNSLITTEPSSISVKNQEETSSTPRNQSNSSSASSSGLNTKSNLDKFKQDIETFKKTRNPKTLSNIQKALQKEDYNNLELLDLLQNNNIGLEEIKDVIPNFKKLTPIKKLALIIKFNDTKRIKSFIQELKTKKMLPQDLKLMLTMSVDSQKHTLLHCAIIFIKDKKQRNALAKLFLKYGANPKATDAYGKNALSYTKSSDSKIRLKIDKIVTKLEKLNLKKATQLDKKN